MTKAELLEKLSAQPVFSVSCDGVTHVANEGAGFDDCLRRLDLVLAYRDRTRHYSYWITEGRVSEIDYSVIGFW